MTVVFSNLTSNEVDVFQVRSDITRALSFGQPVNGNFHRIKAVALFLCILICTYQASSQQTVRDIDRAATVSARTTALGDAYVALASDAGDIFGNPSTLVFLPGPSLIITHSSERKDRMMSENLGVASPLSGVSAFGLGLSVAHTGYLEDSPRATVRMRIIQYFLYVGYAQRISRPLGIGANLGFRYVQSDTYHLREFCPSIGVFYYPSPEISYGLVYKNQGSPQQFIYDSSFVRWESASPHQSVLIGAALRLRLWAREPAVTLSLVNEKILHTKGLIYKGGIEVKPLRPLAIRIGYIVTPNTVYARYGVGLSVEPLRLDYSISPSFRADRLHEITAGISF